MGDTLIVGGGLAALFCRVYATNKVMVIAPKYYDGSDYKLRPNLRFSKLLGKQSTSWGSLLFNLKNVRLHDVNVLGGNSNYWGGFFNIDGFSHEELQPLVECGVKFIPISLLKTGSFSKCCSLYQMQDANGEILNSSKILNVNVDGYVDSIKYNGSNFEYSFITQDENSIGVAKNIYLCVGVVQLIDLMYRSGLLSEGDILTMTENKHLLSINRRDQGKEELDSIGNKNITIYYDFLRAVNHYLGIQKLSWLWDAFPINVKQTFYSDTIELKMMVESNGKIAQISKNKFGDSIHYNNLKINGIPVKQFLADSWPGIEVFGMASLNQILPGPISNQILRIF